MTPQTGIFFDTETTGLPDWKHPSNGVNQPHIVELAAKLVNLETREVLGSVESIVKPEHWVIPPEVSDIHGITQEKALADGKEEKSVVDAFIFLWKKADIRIAHNQTFDERIIRIALKRYFDEELAEEWKAGEKFCTGLKAKPIMQLPPKGRWGYKMPKLSEAYTHFTGKQIVGAHRAMVDVDACMDVYFGLQETIQKAA